MNGDILTVENKDGRTQNGGNRQHRTEIHSLPRATVHSQSMLNLTGYFLIIIIYLYIIFLIYCYYVAWFSRVFLNNWHAPIR